MSIQTPKKVPLLKRIFKSRKSDTTVTETEMREEVQRILRFKKSERTLHWAIAVPFMLCYTTALILVIFYNPEPLRPYRQVFSWMHRISGICFIVLPLLSIIRSRGDYKIMLNNIRQAWVWTLEDLKWLSMMGLAAISERFTLPEQGKFNAAEKINFMVLMSTYPLYILTGAVIWLTDGALLAWLVHFAMALIATPLIIGHLFMAILNPGTRAGLSGMISGYVDRKWAKHHYARWYREHHESDLNIDKESASITSPIEEKHTSPEEPDSNDSHSEVPDEKNPDKL
jgi:formate dehydrogenase gamma subunit